MSEEKQEDSILMIPGPVECHPAVLKVSVLSIPISPCFPKSIVVQALGEKPLSHVAPAFCEEFGSSLEMLREVLKTGHRLLRVFSLCVMLFDFGLLICFEQENQTYKMES